MIGSPHWSSKGPDGGRGPRDRLRLPRAGGDPDNHAQSRTSRLGKLLRIDVDSSSGGLAYRIPPTNSHATSTIFKREIWSLGLRNPFRLAWAEGKAMGEGKDGGARRAELGA